MRWVISVTPAPPPPMLLSLVFLPCNDCILTTTSISAAHTSVFNATATAALQPSHFHHNTLCKIQNHLTVVIPADGNIVVAASSDETTTVSMHSIHASLSRLCLLSSIHGTGHDHNHRLECVDDLNSDETVQICTEFRERHQ